MGRLRAPRRRCVLAVAMSLLLGILVVASSTVPVVGQEADRLRIVTVDVTDDPRVTLTVEPPASMAELDLPADAFSLTENGQPVDTIEVAGLGTETREVAAEALEVVLVVDVSGSMAGEPMALAQEAAVAFVRALPEETSFAVVAFSDEPLVLSPLTPGHATAEAAIDGLEAAGGTALYDALETGVAEFGDASRHALVLLTDGGDTASEATLAEATEALTTGPVEFAAVELVTEDYDGEVLRALADEAGGEVLSTAEPDELAGLYQTVATQLVSRYLVTYESIAGGTTDVELTITGAEVTAATQREVRLPAVEGAVVIEPPEPATVSDPGWVGSPATLVLGLTLFFFAFAVLIGWLLLRQRETKVRLDTTRDRPTGRGLGASLSAMTELFSGAIERRLDRGGRTPRLYAALERAGIDLRPGEMLLVWGVSVLGALLVGGLLGGPLLAIILAAGVGVGIPLYVRRKIHKRRRAFGDQLPDTLQLITGSLRAGHTMLKAVDAVTHDASTPTREEFQRLIGEVRIGRPFEDALKAMHDRLGDEDFDAVVQAVEIHREVGGDLSDILDTVATTVRERAHLHRQVRSLSAEGRMSAIVLLALPLVMAAFLAVVDPDYIAPLFNTRLGNVLIAATAGVLTLGFLWIRRMIRIAF